MSINITMPALSPTMEEGNLAKWLVKVGDEVSSGDVIAEIETDKATMEVEAVDEGVVTKILVPEGSEGVKVNAVIAVLASDEEDAGSVEPAAETVPNSADTPKVDAAVVESIVEKTAPSAPTSSDMALPVPRLAASGERVFASPLARRIAAQKGIDLSNLTGSGPHGRIVKSDVENAAPGAKSVEAAASAGFAAVATGMNDDDVLALFNADEYETKPHDGMRRVIAERLGQSNQTVPSYTVSMDCEIDTLLAARSVMNGDAPMHDGKPAYKISVNDFIVKALAVALQKVPMANASWTSSARLLHKHSDVGVAVAVDDGLFTPIVRKAEQKSLSVISEEIKDMAKRARSKKLQPAEYQGGCTAVSNLGMFGVKEFTSIINPPHASIVSIGAGEPRPVVKNGELTVATVMTATFAFDHRCIDGALGGELALTFKKLIENPLGMLV